MSYGNSGIYPSKPYYLAAWRKYSLRNVDNRLPVGKLRHGIGSLFLFVTPWPPRFPSGARSVTHPSIFVKIFITTYRKVRFVLTKRYHNIETLEKFICSCISKFLFSSIIIYVGLSNNILKLQTVHTMVEIPFPGFSNISQICWLTLEQRKLIPA